MQDNTIDPRAVDSEELSDSARTDTPSTTVTNRPAERQTNVLDPGLSQRSQSYWALSLRRLMRKKLAVFFLGVIIIMYGSGILAPLVAPTL